MTTTTHATFPVPEPITDYSFDWTTRRLPDGFNAGIAPGEETRATVASFFDGDGCATINKNGGAVVSYVQNIKGLDNLLYIQKLYGGTISEVKREEGVPDWKRKFQLEMTSETAAKHLREVLQGRSVRKRQQVDCIVAYFDRKAARGFDRDDRAATRAATSRMKREEPDVRADEPLTIRYVQGLFGAEGHVGISVEGRPTIKISQKSAPKLLHAVKRFFGGLGSIAKTTDEKTGEVKETCWQVTSRDTCLEVARKLRGGAWAKEFQLATLIDALARADEVTLPAGVRMAIKLEAREAIGAKNGGNVALKEAKATRVKAKGAGGVTLKPNVWAVYGQGKHNKDRVVAYDARLDDGTRKRFSAEKLGGHEKALEQATKVRRVPGKRKREA